MCKDYVISVKLIENKDKFHPARYQLPPLESSQSLFFGAARCLPPSVPEAPRRTRSSVGPTLQILIFLPKGRHPRRFVTCIIVCSLPAASRFNVFLLYFHVAWTSRWPAALEYILTQACCQCSTTSFSSPDVFENEFSNFLHSVFVRQLHNLFQGEFSTDSNLVPSLSFSSILSLP